MSKHKAFTLVELLVVISIIALLMALLMPALTLINIRAKALLCQANLKQWGGMYQMYTDDNDGYFLNKGTSAENYDHWSHMWFANLDPYYGSMREIASCPLATKLYTEGGRNPFGAWSRWTQDTDLFGTGVHSHWLRDYENSNGKVIDRGSYAENGYCGRPFTPGSRRSWDVALFWKSPATRGAAYIPVFGDCANYSSGGYDTDIPPAYSGHIITSGEGLSGKVMSWSCIDRHNEDINMLFMDWSVRDVGLKELWRIKWHRKFDTNAGPDPLLTYAKGGWPEWMKKMKEY